MLVLSWLASILHERNAPTSSALNSPEGVMTIECHGCLLRLTALRSKFKGIRFYNLPARSKFRVPTNALMIAVSQHISELLCLVIRGCSDDEAKHISDSIVETRTSDFRLVVLQLFTSRSEVKNTLSLFFSSFLRYWLVHPIYEAYFHSFVYQSLGDLRECVS